MAMKAAIKKRIESACLAVGLCPKDGGNLWCADCQLSWEGTDQEFDELISLAEHLPYHRAPGPTPHRCQCGAALWCETCFHAEVSRMPLMPTPSPLTDEEVQRYRQLSAYLTLRERREPRIQLSWQDSPDTASVRERLVEKLNAIHDRLQAAQAPLSELLPPGWQPPEPTPSPPAEPKVVAVDRNDQPPSEPEVTVESHANAQPMPAPPPPSPPPAVVPIDPDADEVQGRFEDLIDA